MKKIFTITTILLLTFTSVIAQTLAIQMQTSKLTGSSVTLILARGGTGTTVSIDWGDGIADVQTISNSVDVTTTLTKTLTVDNAVIKLSVLNNYITLLTCPNNALTSLDVSRTNTLQYLRCYSNSLTALNVTNQLNLVFLWCGTNSLTSLDVYNNTKLSNLDFGTNKIPSINLINLTVLKTLVTMVNPLGSLDLSTNVALTELNVENSGLTNLDVSHNPNITSVDVSNGGPTYANNLNACALNALYSTLSNRSATTAANVSVIKSAYVPTSGQLNNDAAGSDKTIATGKNWTVKNLTGPAFLTGNGNGCTSTEIQKLKMPLQFDFYPNPANSLINIEVSDELIANNISITELTGKVLLEKSLTSNKTVLDVNFLNKGVYLMSIGNIVRKLIIE